MIDINSKERKKILKSLKGGTVPNQGIQHLAVGRNKEVNAIANDCEDICGGLNSFRIFIGDYGTGKTFLLNLGRDIALKKISVLVMLTWILNGDYLVTKAML